jgi:SHS2 domain-containing protein
MPYKFLEHTADIKIAAEEKNLEDAFKSSALAMREVIFDFEKIKVKSAKSRFLSIEGKDLGDLLYNFLEEFIYLLDADDFILAEIEDLEIAENKQGKKIESYSLNAKILGDSAGNYKFTNKVKAVTFNEMFVKKEGKSFKVQFVLDV